MIIVMVKSNSISKFALVYLWITHLSCKKGKSPKESSIFDHIFQSDYNASFDGFQTLVKEFD